MKTVDRARGRWREILPALGVETRFLTNRHGPCPLCGGKDRFRWDDKDGSGSYYCNQCGPGPGLLLLRKLHGWDFQTAAEAVDKIIGREPAPARSPASAPADTPEKREAALQRIIDGARDAGIVERYLRGRGLATVSDALLGHRSLFYADDGRSYPAMVAPVIGPDGQLVSVHRTYLADVPGARKKIMPPVGTINGAAVRLFEPAEVLCVAEGIETAIASFELFDVPSWAALTANGLETFEPPEEVARVIICADHDCNFAGHKAAYALAHKLAVKGREVEVRIPAAAGTDWLDVLNARTKSSVARSA